LPLPSGTAPYRAGFSASTASGRELQPARSVLDAARFLGHIGGMDVCARALLIAEKLIADGRFDAAVNARCAGWDAPAAQDLFAGRVGLCALADQVLAANQDPLPISGQQEMLESLLNRYC